MPSRPERHTATTTALAGKLPPRDVFSWLVTDGYFPEPYVLPPCFRVRTTRGYTTPYYRVANAKFTPTPAELLTVHFPKSDWTDRTFGIIHPQIHHDIALDIAKNWKDVTRAVFGPPNVVHSYSFPIPVTSKNHGQLGSLRAGRMVYEFIEMTERDVASEAYRFHFLLTTDIKNFYPSLYTHSIAWALHGKKKIRTAPNRFNYQYLGNRLDKLFQSSNDGCTNGIPIGPAVSDLVAEIVLSGVDRELTRRLTAEKLADSLLLVRFKDDYRILATREDHGRSAIKHLQAALKEFRLELNEDKTESKTIPDGLFRPWVSRYHAINPNPRSFYSLKRFREVYLGVVRIDRDNPSCGVIDRFLADLVNKRERLRIDVKQSTIETVVSLVLMLARLRTKAFPKALSILEIILRTNPSKSTRDLIGDHLGTLLRQLVGREEENTYLISWVVYFMRANGMESAMGTHELHDPIARAVYSSQFSTFRSCKEFKVFEGVKTSAKRVSMHQHLQMFP